MDGFGDGVIRIATRTIDMGNRMADGAGDAGLCRRVTGEIVIGIIEFRVVERTAKEGDRVMAAGTES